MKNTLKLILSVLIAESAGIVGSLFTISSVEGWYQTINRPSFTPPSWLFGPVWTTLYLLMGIAAYLIWQKRKKSPSAKFALGIYALQLVLNSIWSVIFFGLQNPGLAFFELIVLLATIIWTTILFWRISKWAGWLFVPYILWSSFALFLNFSIWQLN